MPIRPENKSRYPVNWREIVAAIRVRSGNCCEGSPMFPACRAAHGAPHPETGSRVVLTVGHLDHTPENCDPANLRLWCQRCLVYDIDCHAQNRYITRMAAAMTRDLFAEEARP